MTKKTALEIIGMLEVRYPEAKCALEYQNEPWKLLMLARLSAQCTDNRVNIVSIPLFEKYPTLESMASADITELEAIVKPCGLYHMKARDLKASAQMLLEKYDGKVPDDMDELLSLPGVGRKIANLMLGDIFKKPAIVADTHCIRISSRLGFTPDGEKNPHKVELTLKKIIPPEKQSDFCHRIVQFGRDVCSARAPMCDKCELQGLCRYKKSKNNQK